jgi:glycosyltransferase involved in cell wall biosynthesis
MTNVLITNAHPYLHVHEAFRLDTIDAWAREFGFDVIARVTAGNTFDYSSMGLTNTRFATAVDPNELRLEFRGLLQKSDPQRVINNLEIFVPWDLVETTAEKMYFFRSCAAKVLHQILLENDSGPQATEAMLDYIHYLDLECQFIEISDTFITDSPNSAAAITEMHPEIELAGIGLEYVNPSKYLAVPVSKERDAAVYTVGRMDYQKGLQNIKASTQYEVIVIGAPELHTISTHDSSFNYKGQLPFEKYAPLVADCNFGLFPSIWESNGYTVQECLAMGKIPIVQKGSGGNERLVRHMENGLIIDFKTEHWADWINDLPDAAVFKMQQAAKDTLTHSMYRNSLEKWANLIV